MAQAFDPFAHPELLKDTQRYKQISLLNRIWDGTQYEGRANFWTGQHSPNSNVVPLRERKPCIVYKLPKASVQQVTRFLFGEGRFPRIAVGVNEPGDGDSWYPAITKEQSKVANSWIASLIEHANVEKSARAIAEKAISCKTAIAIVELTDGQFRMQLPRPQDCFARFKDDDPAKAVEKLLWCYEFDKEVTSETGAPAIRRHLFRREWDTKNVSIWPDTELKHGQKVEWGAPTVTAHGLSFCPVLWVRNNGEYTTGIDGESLYEGLEDEFESLDMTLSRRHQGVIHLGAPQLVETGVEAGDGPAADGVRSGPAGFSAGKNPEFKTKAKARRAGPDVAWTYEGENVKVELLETSGKAFEVGTDHVNDIRSRILETMGVVLASMADTVSRTTMGAEMSARFLALAHAPLIALVEEYRPSWWASCLKPLLSMMMRMVVELSKAEQPQRVMIPGTEAALPILSSFLTADGWIDPRMTPHWGAFFTPSNSEIKQNVESTIAARDGKLISNGTAIEAVSHDYSVDSPEDEAEEIEKEQKEKQETMAQFDPATGERLDAPESIDTESPKAPAKKDPKAPETDGSQKDKGQK